MGRTFSRPGERPAADSAGIIGRTEGTHSASNARRACFAGWQRSDVPRVPALNAGSAAGQPMVMKNHHHKSTRRCAHCGQRFLVNPRLGARHRFCSKPVCSRASRICAQKKWLRKNGGKGYFTSEDVWPKNRERVRRWRARNPQYRRQRRALIAALDRRITVSGALAAKMRYVALQDTIDTRFALKIALAIISQTLRNKIR